MRGAFWFSFVLALAGSLSLFGACGYAMALLLISAPPNTFTQSSFEFTIPDDWRCELDGTEYVCQSADTESDGGKFAIIVIAQKWRNDADTLESYLEHLRTPQPLTHPDGTTHDSEVRYARRFVRNGYEWVESLHFQSEVPNYFTYYSGTVTAHKGVLVTYSVHKDYYDRFLPQFETLIASIRVHKMAGWKNASDRSAAAAPP